MNLKIDYLSYKTNNDFSLECKNLNFKKGEATAIIGRNGSGKTTLLECVLGLRKCEKIEATILGVNVANLGDNKTIMNDIGAQIQGTAFPEGIKVSDICYLHRELYRCFNESLYSVLCIDDLKKNEYNKCSLGERRRVDLFFACSHPSKILLLDEFTSGLDEKFQRKFIDWVKLAFQHERSERTLLFTSHSPRELEIAKNLLWIQNGVVKYYGDKNFFLKKNLGDFKLDIVSRSSLEDSLVDLEKISILESKNDNDRFVYTIFGGSPVKLFASRLISKSESIEHASLSQTTEKNIFEYINEGFSEEGVIN